PKCSYDFVPSVMFSDGRVQCSRCRTAFIPKPKTVEEKPVAKPVVKKNKDNGAQKPEPLAWPRQRRKREIPVRRLAIAGLAAALLVGVGFLIFSPKHAPKKAPPVVAATTADALWKDY